MNGASVRAITTRLTGNSAGSSELAPAGDTGESGRGGGGSQDLSMGGRQMQVERSGGTGRGRGHEGAGAVPDGAPPP